MHEKYFEKTHGIRLVRLDFDFQGESYQDVFTGNNNTLHGSLLGYQNKYKRLEARVKEKYPDDLQRPIGKFLGDLKRRGDCFYKEFLNKYGDETYRSFRLKSAAHHHRTGVYAFFLKGQPVYIGRTVSSMKSRINSGHGNITPANCYLHGEVTNCRTNAFIARETDKEQDAVSLWMHPMDDDEGKIDALKCKLIQHCDPCWNDRRG